jgi:hypothetical protein
MQAEWRNLLLLAARKSRFLHCVRHSAHSGRNDNSTLISIKTGALEKVNFFAGFQIEPLPVHESAC